METPVKKKLKIWQILSSGGKTLTPRIFITRWKIKKNVHSPRWKSAQSGLPRGKYWRNVKFKNSIFFLMPVKSKLNFPTPAESLMLRKTPVKFDYLESHLSGLWKPTGVLETGVYLCQIDFDKSNIMEVR